MSIDQYSTTPANNDLVNYFKTGMRPSAVKNAGWDIMADIASYLVSIPTAGGTSSAVTVTNGRPFGSLVAGLEQIYLPSVANAAGATFAPDGLAAKPILNAGHAVVGGETQPNTPIRLKYDGTNWNIIGQAIGSPGLLSGALEATIFTASGNFTPKATANYLIVGIGGGGCGGGGGGGGGASSLGGSGGAGGAGASIGFSIVNLVAGTAYPVVIGSGGGSGSGGASGTNNGTAGGNGTDTTFNGVTIAAHGVGGGYGHGAASGSGAPVSPGTAGGGYGGGGGGNASLGIGPVGSAGAANTGGGGGGGGGGAGGGNAGGGGGAGGSGILLAIRA